MAQIDNSMAMYIFKIFASRPTVIMSWGFSSPTAIENGLRFHVNGFRHKGWCEAVYVEGLDTFMFRTLGKDGQTLQELDDLYLDNLVEVADRIVESGDDPQAYKAAVDEWLEACCL